MVKNGRYRQLRRSSMLNHSEPWQPRDCPVPGTLTRANQLKTTSVVIDLLVEQEVQATVDDGRLVAGLVLDDQGLEILAPPPRWRCAGQRLDVSKVGNCGNNEQRTMTVADRELVESRNLMPDLAARSWREWLQTFDGLDRPFRKAVQS